MHLSLTFFGDWVYVQCMRKLDLQLRSKLKLLQIRRRKHLIHGQEASWTASLEFMANQSESEIFAWCMCLLGNARSKVDFSTSVILFQLLVLSIKCLVFFNLSFKSTFQFTFSMAFAKDFFRGKKKKKKPSVGAWSGVCTLQVTVGSILNCNDHESGPKPFKFVNLLICRGHHFVIWWLATKSNI